MFPKRPLIGPCLVATVVASGLALAGCKSTTAASPAPETPPPASAAPEPSQAARHLEAARTLAAKAEAEAQDPARAAGAEQKRRLARGEAEKAIAADPTLEHAYLLAAGLCEMEGDTAAARAHYDAGLAALPQSAPLRHARGMSALEDGRVKEAAVDLEAARVVDPKNAEVLADLAYVYLFTDQVAQSEALAREARRLAPKAYAPVFTLGEALLRLERYPEAATTFREALAISSELTAQNRLALALSKSGQLAEAKKLYAQLVAGPLANDAQAHAAYASVLSRLGERAEAQAALEKAIELAPDEPKYRALLEELAPKKAPNKRKKKSS